MLFHITHVHTEATCPYEKPEIVADTFAKVLPGFGESGATVVGAYTDPPAHAMYFVVEAADYGQLRGGLESIIPVGTAEIRPVVDFQALIKERAQQG
jgi:hypothetical protein